jgi:hypothetical protein
MIIRKLSATDTRYIDEICQLLTGSYDPVVSKYLIYRDSNYKDYLLYSLGGSRDYIYVALSPAGELMGFIQVRILDYTLFLNNIIITPEFRGANIASGLLKVTINDIQKDETDMRTFALDVFEKNAEVFKWYLRLGMNIRSTKWWYDLSEEYNGRTAKPGSNPISIKKDDMGFTQVYSNSIRIGTLIKGDRLLMRSEVDPAVLGTLKDYFEGRLEGLCLISDKELNYPLIDRSFQLHVELTDIKFSERSSLR